MAEGAGAYFFTGDPATVQVAREKAARQLGALSTMTGMGGRILGEYRRQKEEAENVDLQNRKLNAALGRATAEAQAESSQSLADPYPEEQNALKRVASGALDFGKTALKTTANAFGLGDPHLNTRVMQQEQENAAMVGQQEREKADVSLLGAVNPVAGYVKDPGSVYDLATGGRINIGHPEMVERGGGVGGGLLSQAVRDILAGAQSPAVERARQQHLKDQRDLTQATQSWVPKDPDAAAALEILVRYWRETHPDDPRTPEEIAQSTSIPLATRQDLADKIHALREPSWGILHGRDWKTGELRNQTGAPEASDTTTPSSPPGSATATTTTLPEPEGASGETGDAYIQTRSGRKFKIGTVR